MTLSTDLHVASSDVAAHRHSSPAGATRAIQERSVQTDIMFSPCRHCLDISPGRRGPSHHNLDKPPDGLNSRIDGNNFFNQETSNSVPP